MIQHEMKSRVCVCVSVCVCVCVKKINSCCIFTFQFSLKRIYCALPMVIIVCIILVLHSLISSQNEENVERLLRRLAEEKSRHTVNRTGPLVDISSKDVVPVQKKEDEIVSSPPRAKPLQPPMNVLNRNQTRIHTHYTGKEEGPLGINPLQSNESTVVKRQPSMFVASRIVKAKNKTNIQMQPHCSPKIDIVHLEGFSTKDNIFSKILHTFALRKKLKVLPFSDLSNITDDVTSHMLQHKLQQIGTGSSFNIISKQFVLGDEGIKKYTHRNMTMVVSLGDPVEQFLSVLKNFVYKYLYQHKSVEDILLPAAQLMKQLIQVMKIRKTSKTENVEVFSAEQQNRVKNAMCRQLGFVQTYKVLNADQRILFHRNLREIKSQIGLFFLKNRFDESLLRLRRKLCWDYTDIFYLEQPTDFLHVANKKESQALATIESGLKQWSELDYKLETEIIKIQKMSSIEQRSFEAELGHFRLINKKVQTFCQSLHMSKTLLTDIEQLTFWFGHQNQIRKLSIKSSEWHPVLQVSQTDCVLMNMDALVLRNLNRARVLPHLCSEEFWKSGGSQKLREYNLKSFDRKICSLLNSVDNAHRSKTPQRRM